MDNGQNPHQDQVRDSRVATASGRAPPQRRTVHKPVGSNSTFNADITTETLALSPFHCLSSC